MSGISLSLPLFLIGIGLLVYGWFRLRADQFHSLAFAVSLMAGFVTGGVVWRLDRLAPLAAVTRLPRHASGELPVLAPFAIYTVLATLVFSRFWNVPDHVSLAYGELRFLVQLVNFAGLVGCTIVVSRSFLRGRAVQDLVQVIWWITAINVLVVVYQYVVLVTPGLPQIGISRSFQEEVQLAAFRHEGISIFRPGALAGEPKALAAIMVLYVVTWSAGVDFGNCGLIGPTSSKRLAVAALVVILLTFSTTALVTLTFALLGVRLANAGEGGAIAIRAKRRLTLILFLSLVGLLGVALWNPSGISIGLLNERYIGRLTGFTDNQTGLDQLALIVWSESLFRVVFGTGLGGISFDMMPHIFAGWTLAYAPNIGSIAVLCDVGLLGFGLLLLPLARLVLRSRNMQRLRPDPLRQTARSIGLCLCILWLVGSGPSLGLAVGLGLLASAASRFSFRVRSAGAQMSWKSTREQVAQRDSHLPTIGKV